MTASPQLNVCSPALLFNFQHLRHSNASPEERQITLQVKKRVAVHRRRQDRTSTRQHSNSQSSLGVLAPSDSEQRDETDSALNAHRRWLKIKQKGVTTVSPVIQTLV